MRLKRWVMMLAVVGLGLVGGLYFGRAITSKQSSALPADLQAALSEPTESSPPPAAASVPNASRPLIEWAVDRTVGDLVPDITGHGYDARVHGQPRLAPTWGRRLAFEFDGQGTNDFQHNHSLNCGLSIEKRLDRAFTELTVEAWDRKDAGGWMPIIYRDKWDDASGFGLYMEWSAGKAVFGHYYDVSHKSSVQTESAVQDGRWHYLVGTLQPTGEGYRYCIYVDGKLDAEQTGSWAVTAAPPEGGILLIGYPNSSGADHPFEGGLGGIAVFDVALTPAQIKARFEAQRPAELAH